MRSLELLRNGGNFRWEWLRVSPQPVALFTEANVAARSAARLSRDARLTDDVRAEFDGLARLLRSKNTTTIAVTQSRLVGYDRGSREQAIELDGCVVELKGNGVALTLIEVKRSSTGGQAAAKNQLKDALKKLGAPGDLRVHRAGPVSTASVEIVVPAATETGGA